MTHRQLVTASIIIVSSVLCLMICAGAGINLWMFTTPISESNETLQTEELYLTVFEAEESTDEPEVQESFNSQDVYHPENDLLVGFDETVLNKSREILNNMSLEEKIGQLFLIACDDKSVAETAKYYNVSGCVLGEEFFVDLTKEDVLANINAIQSSQSVPMFIAVEEEGGSVNSVSTNLYLRGYPFWSAQDLYRDGGFEWIYSDTQEKSILLKSLGINMNLAPVVNISENEADDIYERSFGQNAGATAEYVETVVHTMSDYQIGSVLKYLPSLSEKSISDSEICEVFQAGTDAGATAVLITATPSTAGENDAAVLELYDRLRTSMNFNGIFIADLSDESYDGDDAVDALLSGNNMLYSNNYEVQISAIMDAVDQGSISTERIDQYVLRILSQKISLQIINE